MQLLAGEGTEPHRDKGRKPTADPLHQPDQTSGNRRPGSFTVGILKAQDNLGKGSQVTSVQFQAHNNASSVTT